MSTARDTKRIIDALDKWGQTLQDKLDELKDSILSGLDGSTRNTHNDLVRIGLVVSGEEFTVFPWHKLPRGKRVQVEDVYQFMRKNKDKPDSIHNINHAIDVVFADVKDGYHTKADLKAYCYRPNVRDYLESRA